MTQSCVDLLLNCQHASRRAFSLEETSKDSGMKMIITICTTLFERVAALVVLLITMPLLLIGLISLRIFCDRSVVLREDGENSDGTRFHYYRLRTKGRDSYRFLQVGRIVRDNQVDLLPGLWSVVTGDIGLKNHLGLYRLK